MISEEHQKLDWRSIKELTAKRLAEFEIERKRRVVAKSRAVTFPLRFEADADKNVEKE